MQRAFAHAGVQAKLTTTQPGDDDEREADRVADRMMTSSAPEPIHAPCATCSASRSTCPKCENEKRVQRKALPGNSGAAHARVPGLRGAGSPLAAPVRNFFEPRFDRDLSGVRVHTDDSADQASAAIDARAFTLGNDIAFARNQFEPETADGKRLLAHELTHVIQQSNGARDRIARDTTGNPPVAAPAPSPPVARMQFGEPSVCYVPKGPTLTFEGILLASNAEYLDEVLRDYIAKKGEDGASAFVERLHDKVANDVDQMPGGGAGEDPADRTVEKYGSVELQTASRVSKALDEALTKRLAANQVWLQKFEKQANDVVLGMLNESEDRVKQEMIRYGIDWKEVEYTAYRHGAKDTYVAETKTYTSYSMQNTPASQALGEAATGLLSRKRAFDKAEKEKNDYAEEHFSGGTALADVAMNYSGFHTDADLRLEAHLNELRAASAHAKKDLEIFRIQKSTEFPILAAYASEEDISEESLEKIQKVAKGETSAPAASMIGAEIKSRFEHIGEVRDDILNHDGKKTKIWQVNRIIDGTRGITGADPGTMYGRLVDDKVKHEAPGIWTSILIGLLQLVLVLLAPVTGGLTLIPAAAISVAQAYAHFREYERAQMLRGTDFGALALSSEDPSLFWLAVDIIGAVVDVGAAAGAALKVFRALAPAARAAARAAKTAEAAEEAARNLERVASEVGGEALAKAVGRDARQLSDATRVGETAEEANSLERATERMAASELPAGVQEAESIAGRTVKVSDSGALWSCASPCQLLRERYKGLLSNNKAWETKVKDLENEAAKIPKGKAGAAARQEIANRAASLEKEMRTTAKPGEWESPLKRAMSTDEFKEVLERRGSIAPELDHHPKNWTGKDEARFRYSEKLDAEPGYRWTLDENGDLRYDRLDAALPGREYNTATGMFQEAVEGKDTLIKATKGVEEAPRPVATEIPKKQREAMEAAFKKRGEFIAKRDELEALKDAGTISKKDSEKLRKMYAQINEESRQMGENAAEAVMKGKGGKRVYPTGKTHSTSGDFDQVWKKADRFQLVEAKGGSSGLGSRAIKDGVRAEQGTVQYAQSIAENMTKHGATPEIRKLGRELTTAIAEGKVDYILIRAPVVERAGVAALGDVRVSEFVLK